jgi:sulfate adenylyltransferase subunit 1 (EFTu-like GTPase family)
MVSLGRVETGRLFAGQDVWVYPEQFISRVESVHSFGKAIDEASAGMCIGVTLSSRNKLTRGAMLFDTDAIPGCSALLMVRALWMSRQALEPGDALSIEIATQTGLALVDAVSESFAAQTPAQVNISPDRLNYGDIGLISLRLERPIAAEVFSGKSPLGRIVLTRNGLVCGAGAIAALTGRSCQLC